MATNTRTRTRNAQTANADLDALLASQPVAEITESPVIETVTDVPSADESVTLGEGEHAVTVTPGKTYRRGGLTPTARIGRAHLSVTRDESGAVALTYTNRRDEVKEISVRDFVKLYNSGMRLPV